MSGHAGRAALVLSFLLPLFFSACAHTLGNNAGSDAAGVAAIHAYNAQLLKALNAGDAEAMNALMAEDYVMFLPGRPAVSGIDRIRASNRSFLAQWHDEEKWIPDETVASGNWGYQRGVFELVLTPKAGGAARRTVGNYLHIYERKSNGTWRLTRAMTTTYAEK
jgi:uncharacterized protein (TIGR02246 family)